MSMGKAGITTAIGQNTKYIVDRRSGILVPPKDEARFGQELEALLEDSQLRARLGENAERRMETTFTWVGAALDNCLTAYPQQSKP